MYIDGHVCWNSNRRLPFIVCRTRKSNICFLFQLAANKRKFAVSAFCLQKTKGSCHVSVSSVFRFRNSRNVKTGRYGDGKMETWRHRHGDTETWRHGDMETWRHGNGNGDMETTNGKQTPRRFFKSVYRCSSRKRKLTVCKRTTLTCPSMHINIRGGHSANEFR